ncbi:oxidoreductase [Amycolatopsis alba DSM 44262]|uniref:Oxidoreductase n=1 Tax=Amycolatopsis alba DSM 44262 TaxID=1125972 RepID=A0A229RBQ1_AMYAL|nr:oxidoreductase [Amycolatopsis alba DSM 44262]
MASSFAQAAETRSSPGRTVQATRAGTITLGRELTVARIGHGPTRLTGPGTGGLPDGTETTKQVLRRAVELGITFIDTADSGTPNLTEDLIAEALHPYPEDLVIATTAGPLRARPGQGKPCGRPDYLRRQAETSLRRLRVERIDLWQLPRLDPAIPADDQFGALKALQDEGKIRHIGLSKVDIDTLKRARAAGANVASVRNRYNLIVRDSDPVIDHCQATGIVFISASPIAQGILAEQGNPFADLAACHGVSTAQLSLAWLLHRSPAILPIPEAGSITHLEENTSAAGVELTTHEFGELDLLGRTLARDSDVPFVADPAAPSVPGSGGYPTRVTPPSHKDPRRS